MKTLKTIIAVFGLVAMMAACAPADEDVQPNYSDKDLEKFEVKSTEAEQDDPGQPEKP